MTAIEFVHVTKQYGRVTGLDDVTVTVGTGEMVAVVGPSGSGKSTMLHLAGTLDRATSGTVRICGHDVAALSDGELSTLRATSIGFVFQQFHLGPHVTARESVADGLLYAGVRRARRWELAAETLRQVGLEQRMDHRPNQLSGGERQRVAIARAIVGAPQLLLADEPTGNLDSLAGEKIMQILYRLHGSGTTVVIITHDQEIAAGLPRQLRLRDGRLLENSAVEPAGAA